MNFMAFLLFHSGSHCLAPAFANPTVGRSQLGATPAKNEVSVAQARPELEPDANVRRAQGSLELSHGFARGRRRSNRTMNGCSSAPRYITLESIAPVGDDPIGGLFIAAGLTNPAEPGDRLQGPTMISNTTDWDTIAPFGQEAT